MRWSELEGDLWAIPAARYKTKIDFELPLSRAALDVLAGITKYSAGFVFTTTGDAPIAGFTWFRKQFNARMLNELRRAAAERGDDPAKVVLSRWTIHDLRRTARSLMTRAGVPPTTPSAPSATSSAACAASMTAMAIARRSARHSRPWRRRSGACSTRSPTWCRCVARRSRLARKPLIAGGWAATDGLGLPTSAIYPCPLPAWVAPPLVGPAVIWGLKLVVTSRAERHDLMCHARRCCSTGVEVCGVFTRLSVVTQDIVRPPGGPMQSNEYLDTPLAAATLRLSQSTLNKWRLTGGGPKYLKIGRRVLYSRDTLEAWARAHERASTSDPGGLRKAA